MTRSKPLRWAERLSLTLALVLVGTGPALAEPRLFAEPGVVIEAGLFCAADAADRRPAPDTVFGWIHVPDVPVSIILPGEMTAPAVLGLGFGVSFALGNMAPVDLTYVITHPPMPPAGTTRQSWVGRVQPGTVESVFFQFDIPEELLPGDWQIAALENGEAVFRAEFSVVPPEDAPHLAGLCGGPLLLTRLSP